MANKSIAELSADNSVLISEISRLDRGELIEYAVHFTKWLARPIRNREDLPNFSTVIKTLRKDYGIVLSVVHGVGYRLLTEDEVSAADNRMRRIGREAAVRKQELATIELGNLTPESQMRVVADMARAHIVAETASNKGLKKLTAAANGQSQPMALAKALDAIKGNINGHA